MAMGRTYPQALFWIDIEATSLPEEGNGIVDYRNVHPLEFGVIVTDFDLDPIVGYQEVVKLTQPALESLRANPFVAEMHTKNGLLKESRAASATLAQVEDEIIDMLKTGTSFDPGEFMIAGSGVAAYDHPLIKSHMPKLSKWLAYFPFDIGVERRTSKILAGRNLVNPTVASYGDEKAHRAYADVEAHLEEARSFRDFYRGLS